MLLKIVSISSLTTTKALKILSSPFILPSKKPILLSSEGSSESSVKTFE